MRFLGNKMGTESGHLGTFLLGIWLVGMGLSPFVHVTFLNASLILSVLALVTGALFLLRR